MPENMPVAIIGQYYETTQVSFLRANLSHEMKKKSIKMGSLPSCSVILSIYALISEKMDNTKVKIGTKKGGTEIGELELKVAGEKTLDLTGDKMFMADNKDTDIFLELDAEPASGRAVLLIEYLAARG